MKSNVVCVTCPEGALGYRELISHRILTDESEKLRNVIRSKDEELRVADETLANANSDLAKITRERDYLQTQITRLEEELVETKATVDALEEQKTENLQLKETIDRLRLDLDELRTQARANAESKTGGAALSRSASGQESVPATLSKNLGRELARRFAGEAEQETAEPQKQDVPDCHLEDTYEEEEIVTTRRRLVRTVPMILSSTTTHACLFRIARNVQRPGKLMPHKQATKTLSLLRIGNSFP